jgi:hypothetical protein
MAKTTAAKKKSGLPVFWTTRIAAALAGDQPCERATWMGGHYKLPKEQRDSESEVKLALWKTNHTEQLSALTQKLKAEGWACDVERFFRVSGQFAAISGKAEVIAQQKDRRPVIVDVKSGEEEASHILQVLIEMIFIPHAWNAPTMQFDGQVVYPDRTVNIKPADAVQVRPKVFALLKRMGTIPKPDPSPSESACRFCDVPLAECPERFNASAEVEAAPMPGELF